MQTWHTPSSRLAALVLSGMALHPAAEATNGDQRIGLNATQTGMAGAVIAAPEDSGTLLTNPAGIAELGFDNMRMDLGFAMLNPPRSVNGQESDSNWNYMPTGSAAFKLSPELYLGLGMSATAGFGVDVGDAFPMPGNQAVVTRREMFAFAPGLAYKLDENLSLGVGFNIYNQSLAMSMPQFSLPQNRQFGYSLNLGGIYRLGPQWQFGLSYNSQQDISEHQFNTPQGRISMDLDGPAILAAGVAFKPTENMTLEFDIKQIFFSDVRDSVAVSLPPGYAGSMPPRLNFSWSDQTVFAFGIRNRFSPDFTLRAGVNYGKPPIDPEDVNANLGSVAIPETHWTIGFTRQFNKNMAGNFAYIYVPKNEMTSPTGNHIEVSQHEFNFQLTYSH